MKRATVATALVLLILSGIETAPLQGQAAGGWVTLFDGTSLNQWTPVGMAELEDRRQGSLVHRWRRLPAVEAVLHQLRDPVGVLGDA